MNLSLVASLMEKYIDILSELRHTILLLFESDQLILF